MLMKTQTTLDGQIMEESLEQEKTKRLITTVGVDNLIIVETKEKT